MSRKNDALTEGMERLTALLGWWGAGTVGGTAIEEQMKRLHQFAAELQTASAAAYSGQMDAMLATNDRLARSFEDLVRSRRPQEVLAAESEIFATFLEAASQNSKRWAELTQTLQDCSAAIARKAAEDLRRGAQEAASVPQPGGQPGPAATQTPG